jgi:hypothetical protein
VGQLVALLVGCLGVPCLVPCRVGFLGDVWCTRVRGCAPKGETLLPCTSCAWSSGRAASEEVRCICSLQTVRVLFLCWPERERETIMNSMMST